jgi:hypothetical protein
MCVPLIDKPEETSAPRDAQAIVATTNVKPGYYEIKNFAQAMQDQIDANASKGTWENCDNLYLANRLSVSVEEFIDALLLAKGKYGNQPISEDYKKFLLARGADIANYVMMITDNNKCL